MSAPRELTRFTQHEIDYAFKNARRVIAHPGIHILLAPKQKELGRILVIASRKIGNAVQRNKLKRQLRSVFNENKLFENPFDCIVLFKKSSEFSFDDLKKLLLKGYASR